MKLFISFNHVDLSDALRCAKVVAPFCQAFRIGPVLLTHYGLHALVAFREKFPDMPLISDTKILDHEQEMVWLIGPTRCTWVTVLAATHPHIIRAACIHAKEAGLLVMLDLLGPQNIGQQALDAERQGVSALVFHCIGQEEETDSFLDRWDLARSNTSLPIYASTGINRSNIVQVLQLNPDGIILGGAITESDDPAAEAAYFAGLIAA
ncbi:TPA: hypothetical protein DDZ86_04910 [Candidatus Dependentiae bacterium]|nr:MAG: hypothetical protein A2Y17_09715 [Clostridiales bacterium GWF2_38_85]HBL98951.1 hypothetical protein [Candidatus Dependentiae bacterium]